MPFLHHGGKTVTQEKSNLDLKHIILKFIFIIFIELKLPTYEILLFSITN